MGHGSVYSRKEYNKLFKCKNNQRYLDATTDYLYSDNTANLIRQTLYNDEVKIIFILRNPVDRFVSWYKFAMQDGKIPKKMTLQEYFYANKEDTNSKNFQHYSALNQGNYSMYLIDYYNVFKSSDINILYFEDLKENPQEVLQTLSKEIEINSSFYDNYGFIHHNRTVIYRYPKLNGLYKKLQRILRETISHTGALSILKSVHGIMDRIYLNYNTDAYHEKSFAIEQQSLELVREFYSDELKIYNRRSYGE